MGNFVVIVLDGFGIGQMPDVPNDRPLDVGANTCKHIFEAVPDLVLPNLQRLGLANALGMEFNRLRFSENATFGRCALMHYGADTFYGHQEIMGTKPCKPTAEMIQPYLESIARELSNNGFSTRPYCVGDERSLLVVNDAVTVADNVECDPGQAWNVTGALDDISFEDELKIGKIIRRLSTVARVIVFGGYGIHLDNLLNAVEVHGDYVGVNAPKSGVYLHDYHCIHMGYGINEMRQIPYILGSHGINVHLLGKVADVCANSFGESESIVDTETVLSRTNEVLLNSSDSFICANVQETDLCGHRQDVQAYADILRIADRGIGRIISNIRRGDILIVMADHGNDPTIGHSRHTREYVPLLIEHSGNYLGDIGIRQTESDIAATVAEYFGVPSPENGSSFLKLLYR